MAADREQVFPDDSAGLNPLAIIVPVVILGIAILVLTGRNNKRGIADSASGATQTVRKAGRSATRRAVLSAVITVLENDALRRVLIMGLKVARSRS